MLLLLSGDKLTQEKEAGAPVMDAVSQQCQLSGDAPLLWMVIWILDRDTQWMVIWTPSQGIVR